MITTLFPRHPYTFIVLNVVIVVILNTPTTCASFISHHHQQLPTIHRHQSIRHFIPTTETVLVTPPSKRQLTLSLQLIMHLRGGSSGTVEQPLEYDHENNVPSLGDYDDITALANNNYVQQPQPTQYSTFSLTMIFPFIMNLLHQFSNHYSQLLQSYPIRTKSITAGCIFAMSDLLAQSLSKNSESDNTKNDSTSSNSDSNKIVWSRVFTSMAVGLFYFGPAAHYWYTWIFQILPSTSLVSTIQKAILGQLFFGPSFTCIFFATSLLQSGTFTFTNWINKIRNDLPSAWLAGASYWPIVDLISYSYIAPQYIPLFVNICSFFWTTYLVLKSYK
jgi:protein Mpv17